MNANILPGGSPMKEQQEELNLEGLMKELKNEGFIPQQGIVEHAVIFESVDNSYFPNCFDNNADARYVVTNIPPPLGEKNLLPIQEGESALFRMRPDEAIILLGTTPPECEYFSITPYIYERYFEKDLRFHEVFNSLHDPKNNMTLKTSGPDKPFNAFTVIIFSPDRGIKNKVLQCLINAGYDVKAINLSRIPSSVLRMGVAFENDIMMCLYRFYGPANEELLEDYYDKIGINLKVLRVTPESPLKPDELDPYGMPKLRVRGTGKTEIDMMPVMEKLRLSILDKYEKQGWKATEYTTDLWLEEGLQALQANKNMFGENRDVAYMCTKSFTMYDKEFIVIYGVNHTQTEKAAYCSAVVYGKEYYNGVSGSNSMPGNNWIGSADEYLPSEENSDNFFVLTASRDYPMPLENPDIVVPTKITTKGIQKYKPMFVGFRNYLERATKSGPIPEEMISPRVIKFSKPMYP
jgi:hypothetical protein